MKKTAIVLAVCLLGVVLVVSHSSTAAFAATPNDQVAINVTQGTLAANNGVATSPLTLSPAFNPATNDYVLWCQSGVNSEQITLSAASGSLTVTFQGQGGATQTESGSTVNVQVALGENQAVEVVTNQSTAGSYWVRCLPHDFPRLVTTRSATTAPPPGWYLTSNVTGATSGSPTSSYAMVLDQNGTPVWYQRVPQGAVDVTWLNSHTLAWAPYNFPLGQPFVTYDLSTQTSTVLTSPLQPVDPHELQVLTSGPFSGDYVQISDPIQQNVDLTSLPNPALQQYKTIIGCQVEIYTPSGTKVWSWDAYNDGKILPDESEDAQLEPYQGNQVVDMYHCNSADVSSLGTDDVLVSVRQMSAVFDVAADPGQPDDKKVKWKLGGNSAVPQYGNGAVPPYAEYLTTPISGPTSDPEGTFSGQHDARIQSVDPASGQMEISLYDDHSFSGDVGFKSGGARGAIYDLVYTPNTPTGNASFVTQYPLKDSGTAGEATGSFRRYDSGTDNLVGWGIRNGGSGFTEFDQSGNPLLNQIFPNGEFDYRVVKVPPSDLSLSQLRATAGLPRAPYPSSPAWSTLSSGQLTSGPALTSWSSSRYDLFGRGTDGQLWHAHWTGSGWSGWEALGGQIESGTSPAAVAWSANRIDLFIDGVDSQLWHLVWNGSGWGGWQLLGGTLTASPAVASWGANRLDVMVRGSDNGIWHTSWDGSAWNGWESLGGLSASSPGVASWAAGRVDVVIEGIDGQAWHQYWQGGWSGWVDSEGGNLVSGPAVASIGSGELDILAAGQASIPERLTYQGGWQLWQPLGRSPAASAPIAPQTPYAPALVALSSSQEEGCLTNGVGAIECLQMSAGTPAPQQVPAPGAVSPKLAPNI